MEIQFSRKINACEFRREKMNAFHLKQLQF